jgi:putative metallohydrolase (TIGR04338 family)
MLVLHELTHHIAPGTGHGPPFCGIFVALVSGQLGTEVAMELLERFDAHGVLVATRPMGDPDS